MARAISGNKAKSGRKFQDAKPKQAGDFPSREEILRFINQNPDRAAKRDIAKAFAIKGDDRAALKHVLRELEDDGLLEKRRNKLVPPGTLPHVVVLDIFSRDADGGLIARPVEAEASAEARVRIRTGKTGKGPVPGIGDRVLAKVFPDADKGSAPTPAVS